jgi:hypothetical protein
MTEQASRYVVRFDADFPLADVEALAAELMAAGVLAPGFVPPPAGLLKPQAIVYAKDEQGYQTVVLPDRNLVSRMARVAEQGHADLKDSTSRTALALMAYCQALNVDFEPSLAYHELGVVSGNARARDELGWFRAADRGAAREWVALAAGRRDRVDLGGPADPPPADPPPLDFVKDLGRWRRNYVVALRVARLELSPGTPIERMKALIQWMYDDFIFAGPATLYAAMYFAPRAEKAGLFKRLRSKDPEVRLKGVRSAAWDITHLSDFVRRVGTAEVEKRRYVFASGDVSLVQIAKCLFLGPEPAEGWPSLAQAFEAWWPAKDAEQAAGAIFDCVARLQASDWPLPKPGPDVVGRLIAEGEAWLKDASVI